MSKIDLATLAREYARYTCSDISDAQERATDENIEYDFALSILEWLSKNYCIVPKSKVREYAKYSKTFEPIDHLEFIYDIFGTALFNEEKE